MFTQGSESMQPSLMELIKNLDAQGIVSYFKALNVNWVELGMFGAMGALSGFLFKKYFQMFVIGSVLGIGLIAGLDYLGMIHVDWNALSAMVGTNPAQNVDNLFQSTIAWMKVNVIFVVSFGAGFLAGFKVG